MGFFKKNKTRRFSRGPDNLDAEQRNKNDQLKTSLAENMMYIKNTLGYSDDVQTRQFEIGKGLTIKCAVIYMKGLTDEAAIQDFVLKTLMTEVKNTDLEQKIVEGPQLFDVLKNLAVTISDIQDITDYQKLFEGLLLGNVIYLIDGQDKGMSFGVNKWDERQVSEPIAQSIVRGPQDAFNENILTNIALVRRRIKSPALWLEMKKIGKLTKTSVAVMYMKGIANDKTVEEVRQRLKRIDIDGVLEGGNIEELIRDGGKSPFPTVFNTERPDVIAAGLMEGRIAIFVDGTPFNLLVPALFVQFFQTPEDYYNRSYMGSLIRLLRYGAFFMALLAPSIYIALTTFHQEMIPTPLLLSLAAQREGVPFPAFVEAVLMEVTFEIIREAGLRMPRAIGPAVSIVGTLVIGTSAVDAGMVSAGMVIVVSITAIASFVFPNYEMGIAVRMIRFLFMALAASFGFFGISVGLIALVLHLCSLRSFGVPYMSPLAPFIPADQKDALFRLPKWKMSSRPRLINQDNIEREQTPQPRPPQPNEN
ncbi:spore germination protein [Fictibacillus sp. Mic-4]|uniref:spore germination protein n=1 Tax=Fictibacillus sp. Mic-4 TaxID=3132826 RepID=UPI003CF6A246